METRKIMMQMIIMCNEVNALVIQIIMRVKSTVFWLLPYH